MGKKFWQFFASKKFFFQEQKEQKSRKFENSQSPSFRRTTPDKQHFIQAKSSLSMRINSKKVVIRWIKANKFNEAFNKIE